MSGVEAWLLSSNRAQTSGQPRSQHTPDLGGGLASHGLDGGDGRADKLDARLTWCDA